MALKIILWNFLIAVCRSIIGMAVDISRGEEISEVEPFRELLLQFFFWPMLEISKFLKAMQILHDYFKHGNRLK